MKILVAGGAGYIGSHTVYELIDNGADVVIIDSLETGHIEAVHPKARFYQGDIGDRAFLDDVLTKEKNIDGVIHFAANSLVGESMTNPLKYYDNNVYGTKVLLEKLIEYGINHVVFSSTAATYGEPRVSRSQRQIRHSQRMHMVRQSLRWKRCLSGVMWHMV